MKKKLNYLILICVIGLVLYFSLKDNFYLILDELKNINVLFLIIALLFMIAYGLLRSLALYWIAKDSKKDFTFKQSMKNMMITQFFNTTTPFSTGGQPMQVYFLKKEGIKTPVATSIVIENFIIYQLVLIVYGIIGIWLNKIFGFFPDSSILKKLVLIGFLCNFFVMLILFIVSFNKKGNKFVMNNLINFLAKIKIIKNKEVTKEKIYNKIEEFHLGAFNMKSNIKTTFKCLIITFVAFFFLYTIPLIVLYSTNNFNTFNILVSLSATSYTMIMGAFVPIPGASGGIEYGFVQFFGAFVHDAAVLSTILLLWRFITYFITILMGAIALATFKKGE